MESSCEESFGVFSPFEDDEFEGSRTSFWGESNGGGGRNGWDNVQTLPSSPFGGLGGDFDMELEFFRNDVNEDCKVVGPTLAELNDHRSLSPLINPEMERLNQMPKLVSAEMKAQLYSEGTNLREDVRIVADRDTIEADPGSPAVEYDSADEDMDSDEDFDVENHSHGTGLARNRKGRRGDQDDLSPNPKKLLEISRELDRLNKVIGDLKPIHQLPQNARNKSRKEKNKLASR